MKSWKTILAAAAIALATSTAAMAARTDLVLGVVLEPPHLDPTAGAAAAIREVVYANVFEGLTRVGPKGEVLPDLAESWTVSDDGKVYTFRLHSGVKFHDGSDFSAEDVKFSLDRARAPESTNAQKGLFEAIDTVEVVDPTTVKVTLKHPQGAFLYNMGWGDAVIVSPKSADTNKEKPIGTGPFKFDSWARGSSIKLVKSDTYWGDPVYLDKVEFRIIPDASAAVPAILSGDVQAFPNMPVGDSLSQLQSDPRLKVVIGSTEGETILAMNNKKPPFDNLKVRQAISHALDRQAIIDGASNGLGTPIGSHFAPHNPAYIDLTGTYPHDVEKAKELLKEAGLENGFKTTLKLPPPAYARDGGQIIASELREIGIDAEITPLEWADWLKQVFTDKDYDMTIVSHTEPNDIDIYSRKDYYFNYQNADFNKVIDELNLTSDEAKRKELYGEAQKILAKDVPVGFLFELPKIGVWDAKLEGLWDNAPILANDLTKVKWAD
ncbi:peptide/nickel transport system substrate-binding protein [Mesorhizobium soli]|uniref:ABC transporter substrate-binding protein n=1 Tax=Pseudaminobacter soli (ex Li et al. 2025) TaxID=1295366 RepID=UPI002475E7FC|nr:ABC transporter substrate-binding protein [Mesorhizobium soli]MDH6232691.1 peptide/nickel transport system substrate-binding protein [Mesorhizobium soli]